MNTKGRLSDTKHLYPSRKSQIRKRLWTKTGTVLKDRCVNQKMADAVGYEAAMTMVMVFLERHERATSGD